MKEAKSVSLSNLVPLVLNFTHRINEFSFGELYPNLVNPLDDSIEISYSRKNIYSTKLHELYLTLSF
jgi:hypothetical protein